MKTKLRWCGVSFLLALSLPACGGSEVEEPNSVVVPGDGGSNGAGGSSSGGSGSGGKSPTGGATGSGGAGTGGGDSDCFDNPQNHFEIINACTSATRVEKDPDLTLLDEDGSLPAP